MDYTQKIREAREKAEVLHAAMVSEGTEESKVSFKTAREELRSIIGTKSDCQTAALDEFTRRFHSHLNWIRCGAMIPKETTV